MLGNFMALRYTHDKMEDALFARDASILKLATSIILSRLLMVGLMILKIYNLSVQRNTVIRQRGKIVTARF